MLKQILSTLTVTLIVALLTGGGVFWRAEHLVKLWAGPEAQETKSLPELRKNWVLIFSIAAVVFGLAATILYIWLAGRWAGTTALYFWLGLGLTILFSIGAGVAISVEFPVGKAGIPSIIAMNFLWGIGYGVIMPWLLR